MIHKLAIRQRSPGACAELQGAIVDRRDKATAQKHAGRGRTVEEVVCTEGCNNLQDEKTEGETNAFANSRDLGRVSGSAVVGVRLGGEIDDSFDDQWRRDLSSIADNFKNTT